MQEESDFISVDGARPQKSTGGAEAESTNQERAWDAPAGTSLATELKELPNNIKYPDLNIIYHSLNFIIMYVCKMYIKFYKFQYMEYLLSLEKIKKALRKVFPRALVRRRTAETLGGRRTWEIFHSWLWIVSTSVWGSSRKLFAWWRQLPAQRIRPTPTRPPNRHREEEGKGRREWRWWREIRNDT